MHDLVKGRGHSVCQTYPVSHSKYFNPEIYVEQHVLLRGLIGSNPRDDDDDDDGFQQP